MPISDFDKAYLSAEQQKQIATFQEGWKNATAKGDTALANSYHSAAENVRNSAGYTGGGDGGQFTMLPNTTGYTNPNHAGVNHIDTDQLGAWKDAYLKGQLSTIENAYAGDLNKLAGTYNTNRADLYGTAYDIQNSYKSNINDVYNNAYQNNVIARQNASNAGMTSSAQGVAMGTSALVDSSNKASQVMTERDNSLSKVALQLDRLAADFNIDKDTLIHQLKLDQINALSTAEINYITKMLEAQSTNAGFDNNYIMAANNAKSEYLKQILGQNFESLMADKQIAAQKELSEQESKQKMSEQEAYLRLANSLG